MNSTITIVLPVHNGERTLRTSVYQILELAEVVGRRLQVVVVDDGSTDETFENACELARMYPQVCVLRQPYSRGLGTALAEVRRRLNVEHVIVHDGVSALDIHALAELLNETPSAAAAKLQPHIDARGSRRQPATTTLTAKAIETRRASLSLQWLRLDEPLTPRRRRLEPAATAIGETPAILGGFEPLDASPASAAW